MIIGDLLASRVLDHDGGGLGHVVDVRLALELRDDDADAETGDDVPLSQGALRSDLVGQAEVVGLLVSPHNGGSFLGYERTGVRSPWMIASLMRRMHRGTFLVAWEQVEQIEEGTITLAQGFDRLDPSLH